MGKRAKRVGGAVAGQIEHLLEENRRQTEIIQQMCDEIAMLKGQKAKPKFRPSCSNGCTPRSRNCCLCVLKHPDIVLHTNGSEGDNRGHMKWRKISGSTRSDLGKPSVWRTTDLAFTGC